MSIRISDFLEYDYEGTIEKVLHDEEKNEVTFFLNTPCQSKEIENKIKDKCQLSCLVSFDYINNNKVEVDKKYILKLLKNKELFENCCASLNIEDIDLDLQKKIIKLEFSGSSFYDEFTNKNFVDLLENMLFSTTEQKYKVITSIKEQNQDTYWNRIEEKEKNLVKHQKQIIEQMAQNQNKKKEVEDSSPLNYGRSITDIPMPIKDLSLEYHEACIQGTVIKKEYFQYRNKEGWLLKFYISDEEGAVNCILHLNNNRKLEIEPFFKEGIQLKIKGEISYDPRFEQAMVFKVNQMAETNIPLPRMDLSAQKRIELHLYSQMSQVDGFVNLDSLFKRLKAWGHRAVGITDKSVVQAFPELPQLEKKYGIKALYGMDAWLLEDDINILNNIQEADDIQTIIVFDIETTGLSRYQDNITEIGAVKIEQGKITDVFSQLVNPEMPISQEITELTGITNAMVENAPTIDVVMPQFLEFIGDGILAAHNATFDIGFISEKCYELGLEFKKTSLDTLVLSRALYPEERSHTLDKVARRLEVSLVNHHRAEDDARATAEILLKMIEVLKERGYELDFNINKLKTNYPKAKNKGYDFLIYPKNLKGLKNLYELVSLSSLNFVDLRAGIPRESLKTFRNDLLLGTGTIHGELFQAIVDHKDEEELDNIIQNYDFVELQPISVYQDDILKGFLPPLDRFIEIHKKMIELADKHNKLVVASGNVRYLDPQDYIYRNIILESQVGRRSERPETSGRKYLRTTEEMLEEFYYLSPTKREEIVIHNTHKIANNIEDFRPIPEGTFPPEIEGSDIELREMTVKKAKEIYGDPLPNLVENRLNRELDSIISNGYAVLYIISQKLVEKSKEDGYLVGSRGSVGSSFAATMAGITEVNPLRAHYICPNQSCKNVIFSPEDYADSGVDLPDKYCPKCGEKMKKEGHNIPFEVFLGFEGDKEPDIDLNFAGEYQGYIHQYTEELFGSDKVFRAGTIGAIQDNTAYGYIKKYMERHEIDYDQANILRLQQGMIGVKRTSGQHPGGIMIVPSDKDITDFTPVQHPADDMSSDIVTTHFTYQSIEENILKLDLLGHDVPSIIRMLETFTEIDALEIPLDDPETISIFSSVETLKLLEQSEVKELEIGTLGIPEFGTGFVRQMLMDTRPKSLSELVRISGLSHGTDVWINNAQDLIQDGQIVLSQAICTRDDIMIYLINKGLPEQTAFTIMELVRKNRFKTNPKFEEYVELMKENDIPDWYINSCQKIQYLFPKAHAVAYVLMSFRIAYFKVHYPAAFYATYFTTKIQDYPGQVVYQGLDSIQDQMRWIQSLGYDASPKEKSTFQILEVAEEMYLRGLKVAQVSLSESDALDFKLIDDKTILPPLRALDGVSDAHALSIKEALKDGDFISIEDMRQRTNINKVAIASLKEHGVLDGFSETNQLSFF